MTDRRKAPSVRRDTSFQADVGVALMVRNGEDTLPHLLDSIRPFVKQIVVGVDVSTTDHTARVAKKHGADEVFDLVVSTEHECAAHGKIMAQHFARARQETFKHLDPALTWWMWLDADDVLVNGQLLKPVLDALPEDQIGLWLNYEYASIEGAGGQRQVNTEFFRERVLRTHMNGKPVTWTWEGRVHETVKPDGPANWARNEEIIVRHQPGVHQTGSSAPRNLTLLEIDFEEDHGSPRTLFYLGNQHFALGNWMEAIRWYELLATQDGPKNPYELWQAYVYMSLAYERLGNLDDAVRAAFCAIDVVPAHPEPWYRLAALADLASDFEKALFFNKLGRQMVEPPFFAFKNPLDYSFNQRMVQADALLNLGRVMEAQKEWEAAAGVYLDDHVKQLLAENTERIRNMNAAQGFVEMAGSLEDKAVADSLYDALPTPVKAYGRTRDLVMPFRLANPLRHLGSSGRIVFWCGQSLEPWAPPVLNTTGIGGSETAVVEIAKRFARDGWTVDVYNGADKYEGIYESVGYWDMKRWTDHEKCDVFVSWRRPDIRSLVPNGATAVLWCHDLNYGPGLDEAFDSWDRVLGVSDWHRQMLTRYYGGGVGYDFVPNGIDLSRFDRSIEKKPLSAVYASSPDRGLSVLLDLWPQILKVEPGATLQVAYGWENIDKMIDRGRGDLAAFKAGIMAQIERTPNVTWRGRLPQDELARLYSESVIWAYPADFLEVSCISAMEAMAGGAIPVVTRCGALPETVGEAGFLVPGPPRSRAYADVYPKVLIGAMTERNVKAMFSEQARRRATGFTWDAAFDRWKAVLGLDNRTNGHIEAEEAKELVLA